MLKRKYHTDLYSVKYFNILETLHSGKEWETLRYINIQNL